MTILENLRNSREFPPGILGTVDSREFSGILEREFQREIPVALLAWSIDIGFPTYRYWNYIYGSRLVDTTCEKSGTGNLEFRANNLFRFVIILLQNVGICETVFCFSSLK